MQQHLAAIAELDITPIFAARSLLSCELPHEAADDDSVRVDDLDGARAVYAGAADRPFLLAREVKDDLQLQRCDGPVNEPFARLAGLLGFGWGKPAGNALGCVDRDKYWDRVMAVDAAWVLLRRMKRTQPDLAAALAATHELIVFANTWHALKVEEINRGEFARWLRESEASRDKAGELLSTLAGIRSIRLNEDPRACALAITTVDDPNNALYIPPLVFDWPMGLVSFGADAGSSAQDNKAGRYDVRPTQLPEAVVGALVAAVVNGLQVTLPMRLSPKLYQSVNDVLTALGGTWHTGRQAHVFTQDPAPALAQVIRRGAVYTAKDYEFFATQPTEVDKVMRLAQIEPGMKVLEPNAGDGALALAAAAITGMHNVTCHELMPANVETLRKLGFAIEGPVDFLSVKPAALWDRAVLNPPFSGGRDRVHIRHAARFLKPGGRLVAIASTTWRDRDTRDNREFREWLDSLGATVTDIAAGAFKAVGTNVPTTLISLQLPLAEADAFAKSRVVHTDGTLKEVFHGTSAAFKTFAANERGLFFDESKTEASSYSGIRKGGQPRVIRAHLNICRPWDYIEYGTDHPYNQMVDQSVASLTARGYDGMRMPNGRWIAFRPDQVRILGDEPVEQRFRVSAVPPAPALAPAMAESFEDQLAALL